MTATLTLVCDAIGSRHQFGPNGGAFGRSRKCDWVLPDPDRHLSSVHARILFQNDTFVLIDESTNGTFLEGQSAAIGRGKAVSLSPGMKLLAGPYQIRVDSLQASQATQTNPFAAAGTGASGRPAPAATPLRIDTSGASLPKNTSLDPLDHLGGAEPAPLTPVASVQTPQNLIPEPVSFSAPNAPPSPHETTRYQGGPGSSGQAAPAPQVSPTPQVSAPQASSPQPSAPMMPPAGLAPAAPAVAPPVPVQPAPAAPHMPASPMPQTATAVQPPPATPQSPAAGTGNVIPEDFLAGFGAPAAAAPSPSASPPAGQSQGLPDLTALMPAPPGPAPGAPASPAAPAGPATPAATIPDNIDFGFGAPSPATASDAPAPQATAPQTTAPQTTATPPMPAAAASPGPPAPAPEAPLNPLDALKKRRAQREAELAQKAKSRADSPLGTKRAAPAAKAAQPASPPPPRAPVPQPPASPLAAPPVPGTQVPAAQIPATPAPAAPTAPAAPAAATLPSAPQTSVPARTRPAAGGDAGSDVFEALVSGLGFANADVPPEDQAEIARAAGEMVRELANGLIALLNARKSLKTEFRMYETRIQPEENNPFKHFNVGELAIDEMLFARKGGFLPPPEAAREAFKDLQSHTMLTVAATQRAMRILFESLSPETLAGEEDDGGLRLRGLGSRRGKFEAAKDRHDRLRADFDAVVRQTIAEAFVQVEEDQARQQSKTFWENRKK